MTETQTATGRTVRDIQSALYLVVLQSSCSSSCTNICVGLLQVWPLGKPPHLAKLKFAGESSIPSCPKIFPAVSGITGQSSTAKMRHASARLYSTSLSTYDF